MNGPTRLHLLPLGVADEVAAAARVHVLALAESMNTALGDRLLVVDEPPQWLSDRMAGDAARSVSEEHIWLFERFVAEGLAPSKVLVICGHGHPLAVAAREHGAGPWGGAFEGGALGFVYANLNRFLIWHELLHLFGAADCYDQTSPGPTCGEPRCIMQYEPSEATTGPGLILCSPNWTRVRRGLRSEASAA